MTRAKDISKIVTDANLSGTLDVTGAFTSQGIDDNADATAITIDSSENVGINNSSPATDLDVTGNILTSSALYLNSLSVGSMAYFSYGGGNPKLWNTANGALLFGTNNTERMRIDSSGNVGIGASSTDALESRTAQGYRSLRLNNFNINAGEGAYGFVGQNIYQDSAGVYKFIDTGDSSSIHFWGDAMQFHMANGSADATQSGSERMRIDSSGNVGIGTSSPSDKLHISGTNTGGLRLTNSNNSDAISLFVRGGNAISSTSDDAVLNVGSRSDNSIITTGNVGIGINSPASLLHLKSSTVDARLQLTNSASADDTTNSGASLQLFNDDLYINAVENSGNIIFRTDGGGGFVERMRIFSNGHVSVGTTDNTYGFNVGGSGSDVRGKFQGSNQYRLGLQNGTNDIVWLGSGGANNFRISNSAGATKLTIDSNGNLLVGRTDNPSGVSNCIYALGNYGVTTGSGANVFINSEGLFFRSTSSLRYKNTINDATHGLTELLTLRPVTYKGNNDGDTVYGGLIAEEVHDAGLTEFVQYNDDGEPDALAYGNMVSLCIKAIQELKAELDSAKARITALENGE